MAPALLGRWAAVLVLMGGLATAAGWNLVDYHRVMGKKLEVAQQMATLPMGCDIDDKACERTVRHNFYTLLQALKLDPAYSKQRYAVFVDDPSFFAGAYIDQPYDTLLKPCAIQPFSIPALTGKPLLGALHARDNGCAYNSYGYQYLPNHAPASEADLEDACTLAHDRGFTHVAIIRRQGEGFVAERSDCAAS